MSWFVDLHDSSLQNTYNTYEASWFRIIVNYNDSSEKKYNKLLKPLTNPLTFVLFVFNCKEKY